MRFDVASELEYSVAAPSTFIFNVHALRTPTQTVLRETLAIEPFIPHEEFASIGGESRFIRLAAGTSRAPKRFTLRYSARVEVEHARVALASCEATPMSELAHDIVHFLFPSRYCESDMLGRLAWRHFGKLEGAYERVLAITDWVHDNVEYARGTTNAQTSAYDTITQGAGVCRDFAHLSIALCRALNIPARYFTGYAYGLTPPDFHACFEAFIGGRWMLFDATRLVPLNGLVRIAMGRDAADTSVATIFGRAALEKMAVRCELAEPTATSFEAVTREELGEVGVSLDHAS